MPKIIIKEIDNTKAGQSAYKNFSVLVPGFCAVGKGTGCFDDNGVYECKSLADFNENIGKIETTEGVCAKYEILPEGYVVSEDDFNGIYKNQCYTFEIITDAAQQKPGKLKVHNEIGWFKLTLVTAYNASKAPQYAVVLTGNEGYDEALHVGNQVAFELISLGYTVLYKKIASLEDLNSYDNFWAALEDKSVYDFRYIVTGLLDYTVSANSNISLLAAARKDCVALLDVAKSAYDNTKTQKQNLVTIKAEAAKYSSADKYSAIFVPCVTYAGVSVDGFNNNVFPASFHYLACAAKAQENNFAEWYAVAGYTRGISKYTIDSVGCKLGEVAINELEPRIAGTGFTKAINVITNIRGNYYIWGNRTAHLLDNKDLVASHFLNIRQLCSTLIKQLYINCRQLTFDPNSDVLWINFCNLIRPTLEKMKADQGIADYKIVKAKTSKKATLRAIVRIVPIEAVEDFEINVYLDDSLEGEVVFVEE